MSLASFIACLIFIVRFKQIGEYTGKVDKVLKLNKIAIWFGLLSALGLLLVASFQDTNTLAVHMTGAGVCFFFGTLYEVRPRDDISYSCAASVLSLCVSLVLLC